MTKRIAAICLGLVLWMALAVPSSNAQDLNDNSLKGITAVSVVVENLPEGAKVLGLTAETIQTDVELKLRLAGMQVVPAIESAKYNGAPYVYVNVNLTDGAEAVSIMVELEQDATLLRNGQYVGSVPTWSKSMIISHPTTQALRDSTKDLTDRFLNTWLSVNPRK